MERSIWEDVSRDGIWLGDIVRDSVEDSVTYRWQGDKVIKL